ncbi:C-X-C motif chemokine 11 [Talpa occidentalis]|uniref:C-X-C motif chemokine 11 n=1 Tax=Talpa occidentalis TaxID=50954 RepID=UPI00188FAB83|nr:C-X-C motif chemokine 11 [Talpa occidentalis]
MNVTGMTIVLAVILCATTVQGFPMFRGGRCLCLGPGVRAVKVASIKEATILYPSNSCDKTEVIITLKFGKGKRCLNPTSKLAKEIIKRAQKNQTFKISKRKSS